MYRHLQVVNVQQLQNNQLLILGCLVLFDLQVQDEQYHILILLLQLIKLLHHMFDTIKYFLKFSSFYGKRKYISYQFICEYAL